MVDDQVLRGASREALAEVLADQGERQVDAGSDAGRAPEASLTHENAIRLEPHARKAAAKLLAAAPVRGGGTPIEQPGSGEQERAGADARHAARPQGACLDEAARPRARERGARALTAGYDEGVNAVGTAEGTRRECCTRGARDCTRLRRDDAQLVRSGSQATGDLERRYRAGGIEQLKTGEDQEGDAACHGEPQGVGGAFRQWRAPGGKRG